MHGRTIRRHPIIALLPIFMTGIMIGLGVWGVLAASRQYSDDKQNQAQVRGLGRAKGRGMREGKGEGKFRLQAGCPGRYNTRSPECRY